MRRPKIKAVPILLILLYIISHTTKITLYDEEMQLTQYSNQSIYSNLAPNALLKKWQKMGETLWGDSLLFFE